jgi:16S rRNA (cytidine1402-2'-O)-methyltransferase
MPTLYIVATPIGNLEDITLRALRVLKEVGLIAAEDTRVTRKLLSRYDIHTPLTSYHEHNKQAKLPSLLEALAEKDLALVSDAGMPGISDPGYELVRAASKAGFSVVPVPGASALTAAVAVSGLPLEQFIYLGFLPRKPSERRKLLHSVASDSRALVAFETPHRLREALEDILAILGDRRIAVCNELTKLYEKTFRGAVSEALEGFAQPRGEFTLVIEGRAGNEAEAPGREEDARALLAQLRADGFGAKDAVAQVVEATGLPRREVYRMWLELPRSRPPQLT